MQRTEGKLSVKDDVKCAATAAAFHAALFIFDVCCISPDDAKLLLGSGRLVNQLSARSRYVLLGLCG